MAKVMSPLHSTEARGRVGGLIYNTWRGISYVKCNSSPAQPRSALQLKVRSLTTHLTRKWGTLLATTRTNWNDYAVTHTDVDWTNNPKRLSGMNWYVRCNLRLLIANIPEITEPPSGAVAPAAPTSLVITGGILQCTVAQAAGLASTLLDIYLYGPHSAGLHGKIERAKHKLYGDGEDTTNTITGLRPGTYSIWERRIDTLTGLASPWMSGSCVVTVA